MNAQPSRNAWLELDGIDIAVLQWRNFLVGGELSARGVLRLEGAGCVH